ncbi:MAG: C1 family peptidase, partial [Candidatus Nanoarchaeia archaeon]
MKKEEIMKKIILVFVVLVFLLSLFNFVPLFSVKFANNVAKANSFDNLSFHPTGCIPAPVKNWPKINLQKLEEDLISKGITTLPSYVDWSSKIPPVGDQGGQGSCTAWATSYYYKTFQEGKEQNWNLSSLNHQFSPAFVYNQINGGNDRGSAIPDALNLLVDKGCDTLAVFPYNQYDYTTQPNSNQLQLAFPFKAQSFANVFQGQGNCSDSVIGNLKAWLANGDIFVIAIPVYSEFDSAPNDPSYVVPPHNPNDTPRGWHALAVVGYNDNLYYTDNSGIKHYGAFKIVNSWGPSYGYNGFVNLSYDFFKVDVGEAWTMTDAQTPQDFTIGAVPLYQSTMAGGSSLRTIYVDSLSGFNSNVVLSVSGLPTGINYTISNSSVNPPTQVNLSVQVSSSVSAGVYTFNVVAYSGSITHSLSCTLEVKGSSGMLIHVKDQSSNPAARAYVQLFSNTSNYSDFAGLTDDTGTIYFANASGTYTVVVSSSSSHFGIMKTNITAPGEYTFDTTGTQHFSVTSKKKDGSFLSGYISFSPFKSCSIDIGYSSGTINVDITPGTYTTLINGINDGYLLVLPSVIINSSTTQVVLDSSTMPTGSFTLTSHNFDYGYLYAWGSYCGWAYGFMINSSKSFTFSSDTYDMIFVGYISAQDNSKWSYELRLKDSSVTITNGSNQSFDAGGNLYLTSQPEKASYYIGDQVKLLNKVSDTYGNRLQYIYEYLPTVTIDFTRPLAKDNPLPGYSASFGPLIKIVGPDNNVYYQNSNNSGFYNTYFTPSSNWPLGNYSVNISLYTGPLQGTVYGNVSTFSLNSYPPDQFEPDDTPQDAKLITTDGISQTHNFSKQGDVDWCKFTAVEGKTYTIDTLNLGSNCDTVIELYAPDGTTLIDYNDWFDWPSARIDFEVPAGKSGTYYIKVSNFNPNTFGDNTNYDIRVYPALKISFSPELIQTNTPTNVTVTITQDGNPVSGANVYNSYTGTTLTTNSSGQVTLNINLSYSTSVYFEVTYGNYKRCYDYLYVLDNSSSLLEVKPIDKNGYYLTNFYLIGYSPSNSLYYWWSTWSSYRNSAKVLLPSGNNLIEVLKNTYYTRNSRAYYLI